MYEKTYSWYNLHTSDWVKSAKMEDMSWPYSDFIPHLNPQASILDLGCGCGRDISHFQKRGFSVHGLDASIKLCNAARQKTNAHVFCQNFDSLTLRKNHYDGIFANAVLMHVNPKSRINFLKNIYDALKSNGIFYAHFPKGEGTKVNEDGRILHLSNAWASLANEFNWLEELNEGRPAFLSTEDQNWQVIRYRKS